MYACDKVKRNKSGALLAGYISVIYRKFVGGIIAAARQVRFKVIKRFNLSTECSYTGLLYFLFIAARRCSTILIQPSLLNQIKVYSPATCISGHLCRRDMAKVCCRERHFGSCCPRREGRSAPGPFS